MDDLQQDKAQVRSPLRKRLLNSPGKGDGSLNWGNGTGAETGEQKVREK